MSDDMERVEETGFLNKSGQGFKTSSVAKKKDGDESVADGTLLGSASQDWMTLLSDGCTNPYPITSEALKAKNTRKANDSFS